MLEDNWLSLLIFVLGGFFILVAMASLLYSERKCFYTKKNKIVTNGSFFNSFGLEEYIVLLFVILFFVISLYGVELRGITHVESYIPGLNLPAGISEPPRRIGLLETIQWHWHAEPHPPGYFIFMWFWTKLFGTSLTAIRLPGIISGGISIAMIFILAARVSKNKWAGVIAAGLLAFNGHHLYWSLMARHYEIAMVVGLISTATWLSLISNKRLNFVAELCYIFFVVVGLYIHVLFWVFFLAQIIYTVLMQKQGRGLVSRALYLQVFAIITASPMILHALYIGQDVQSGGIASLSFFQDFLNFGFLFQYDPDVDRDIFPALETVLTLIVVSLLVIYSRSKEVRLRTYHDNHPIPSTFLLLVLACGFSLILWALVREAWKSSEIIQYTVAIPIVAFMVYQLLAKASFLQSCLPLNVVSRISPMLFITFITLAIVYLISLKQPVAVSRGLLLVVPPLLISLAGGLFLLIKSRKWVGIMLLVFIFLANLYSIGWYKDYAIHNDYRGLADQLIEKLQPEDLIFVPRRNWATTPIFYHLPDHHHQLVAMDHGARVKEAHRVWVISLDGWPLPDIEQSVAELSRVSAIEAHLIKAVLYQRQQNSD